MNVLLVVVDALRYDRVSPKYMPWLHAWGEKHTIFTNCHSTSHCTDPSVTHMLSGRHPDELKLYSMMYDDKAYTIPEDVEMLAQTAQKNGFSTGCITNLGRWYERGMQHFVDCRHWEGMKIFHKAQEMVGSLPEPWFLVVHTDDCHTRYTGGSYDAACEAVDSYLKGLMYHVDEDNTTVLITADHGEGLGQSGPDGHAIKQHAHGLWDFLTHIPLVGNFPLFMEVTKSIVSDLADNGSMYWMMRSILELKPPTYIVPENVFQAGANPDVFHRGIVAPNGNQFVRATYKDGSHKLFWIGECNAEDTEMEDFLAAHCKKHGIDYGETIGERIVIDRLKGLGYFE